MTTLQVIDTTTKMTTIISQEVTSVLNSTFTLSPNITTTPNSSLNVTTTPNPSLNITTTPNSSLNITTTPNLSLNITTTPNPSLNITIPPNPSLNITTTPTPLDISTLDPSDLTTLVPTTLLTESTSKKRTATTPNPKFSDFFPTFYTRPPAIVGTTPHTVSSTMQQTEFPLLGKGNGNGEGNSTGYFDNGMVPPFVYGIGGAALFLLLLIVVVFGLLLRINIHQKLSRREQLRRKKPPYMDFNYPLNAFPSNHLNEFPPKPNFSMEAKPSFQHSTPFQAQIPRAVHGHPPIYENTNALHAKQPSTPRNLSHLTQIPFRMDPSYATLNKSGLRSPHKPTSLNAADGIRNSFMGSGYNIPKATLVSTPPPAGSRMQLTRGQLTRGSQQLKPPSSSFQERYESDYMTKAELKQAQELQQSEQRHKGHEEDTPLKDGGNNVLLYQESHVFKISYMISQYKQA
ncbi:uncharacterized protein LOC111714076 isoform X2 [Eurytemora carolleeae]|uniref:uncharacterized protein LOC111714076 isoform X2 n=1 Tax=Eurytemora carolleeae TaxID=1294199 RepID=UPI000C77796E|nr:uncharacterized protein LOC111714076 isoform X2 [Eurytemora carolleeae]|eukprot:XP_023344877.1 uncharacterized protein LOC111714076 isoform X2 [Eurytemora affinis]